METQTVSQNATPGSQGFDRSSLDSRIQAARAALEHCELCERRCGANRLAGEPTPCRLDSHTYCAKRYVSLAEELELVPALRVYWGGCNFRCEFCNTAPGGFEPRLGERVAADKFALELHAAVATGVKTINLLGGEPSLHPHTILEVAAAAARPLPLVLSTNAYMTAEVLELFKGVVDMYSVDFKFGNDRCARHLAQVPCYMKVVTRNLAFLSEYAALRVCHLLLPGHLDCCFRPVVEWLSAWLPESRFHLLTSYVPAWRAESDREIGRLNRQGEVCAAVDYLESRRLDWSVDADGDR